MSKLLSPQDFYQQADALRNNQPYQASVHNGQQPHTFIISCCDSRVDPTLLFGSDMSEVFSLRIIANIVPAHSTASTNCPTAAAILYAVKHLHIPQIVIVGHSACGGIHALCQYQASGNENAIDSWISTAVDSLTYPMPPFPEAICLPVDQQSLRTLAYSYHNLENYPVVKEAIANNALSIEAWFYQMEGTSLYTYDANKKTFTLAAY